MQGTKGISEMDKEILDFFDPRFGKVIGINDDTVPFDPTKAAEDNGDPWLEAFGDRLDRPPENKLKQFVENATLEDYQEVAQRVRDPELLKRISEEVKDREEEKAALEFLKRRPEYEATDWNFTQLRRYLHENELAFTVDNLEVAFDELLKDGWISTPPGEPKELSEWEQMRVARMAQSGSLAEAVVSYLKFALPGLEDWQIQNATSDPKYRELCDGCTFFVFSHATNDFKNTEENFEFLMDFADGRPLTVGLLQEAWSARKRDAILHTEDLTSQPEAPDLDSLPAEEQERLYHAAVQERARQMKQQR